MPEMASKVRIFPVFLMIRRLAKNLENSNPVKRGFRLRPKMIKIKKPLLGIVIETLPILFGIFLSFLLWQNNLLLLIAYLILSISLILYHRDNGEFLVLVYGIVIGMVVEVLGTQKSGYQSFTNPDFWGIPMWLPVAWGYGFVAMKRIGFLLRAWK